MFRLLCSALFLCALSAPAIAQPGTGPGNKMRGKMDKMDKMLGDDEARHFKKLGVKKPKSALDMKKERDSRLKSKKLTKEEFKRDEARTNAARAKENAEVARRVAKLSGLAKAARERRTNRKARALQRREERRRQAARVFGTNQVSAAFREALKKHVRRLAHLSRIEEVAAQSGDEDTAFKAAVLRERETKRFEKMLQQFENEKKGSK